MFCTPLEFCVTHSEGKLEVIFPSTQNFCALCFYAQNCLKDQTLHRRSRTTAQNNITIVFKKREWPIEETTIKKTPHVIFV